MIDNIMIRRDTPRDVFTDAYRPTQAVIERKLVNPDGKNLHVLFSPWHGGKFYERLINKRARQGNAVLAFYFHDEILKPDINSVVESFAFVRNNVPAEISKVRSQRDYQSIRLTAMSLGNPVLATVLGEYTDFDGVTAVCTADTMAGSVWNGKRTQHIRSGIEQSGYSLEDALEAWHDMGPINHLDALAGKDVKVIMSSNDEIIPTIYQREFVEGAIAEGIDPKVQTTRLGHYATIARFCINGNI